MDYMSYKDLHTFMEELDRKGELKQIEAEVSAELEITEITDRISKAGGPALLFKRVTGSNYPVLMNMMGSYERMSMGLGAKSLDEVGAQVGEYLELGQYLSIKGLFKAVPRLLRLLHAFPSKSRRRGRCQQIIERKVDLGTLPVLKCWPEDAGRFITLPLVFTKDSRTKRQNVGMYRLQLLDKESTAMHWHKHKDGSEIYEGYAGSGRRMPVSVAIGCDPEIIYSSTAPLPKQLDEMMLAGWLRKKRVKLVKCITNDIWVPENAEIILEGYVDPGEEPVLEGPFGDHTGYYSLADYYPRFHVTCITHRRNAVYPATVVGRPPMEDCYMAKATERVFLPLLKMIIPELVDMSLPLEGVFHNCAIVSVNSRYPGCARKVMNSIWGTGQMMYTKLIVAVDEAVNVQNLSEVRDAVTKNVNGKDSLFFSEGPLDALDHSSNRPLYGCRLGVDATRGSAGTNNSVSGSKNSSINITDTFRVIAVHKERPGQAKEVLEENLKTHKDKFVICVDDEIDPQDLSTVMWKVFNNIDAGRDLVLSGTKIGIDATKKWREEGLTRDWPDDIVMTEEIKRRVSERWKEYGFNENNQ